MVTALAEYLGGRANDYLYVASTAAYAGEVYARPGFTEDWEWSASGGLCSLGLLPIWWRRRTARWWTCPRR